MKMSKLVPGKIVFWGSPRFAEIVLVEMIEGGWRPGVVICNPDRPTGRKKIITPPPIKRFIKERGLETEVWQPDILDNGFIEKLKAVEPEVFVVAAYAKIIPKEILEIPRQGAVGVHPSLLPRYRGASPIQSAILGSEKVSGVTLYLMDEKMDHGPILAQKEANIEGMNYLEAEAVLAEMGGGMAVEVLRRWKDIKPKEQNYKEATFTKKFKTEDGEIGLNDLKAAIEGDTEKAKRIDNKVRALGVEPGVYIVKDNKRIKILKTDIKDGKLKIGLIQKEGKRPVRN